MDSKLKRQKRRQDVQSAIVRTRKAEEIEPVGEALVLLFFDVLQDIERNTESIGVALAKKEEAL